MGASTPKKTRQLLTEQEINEITDKIPSLSSTYDETKSSKSGMTSDDLATLFSQINPKLVHRMFKTATADKKFMSAADFRYLFALLTSENVQIKSVFMTDIIFTKYDTLPNAKYKKRLATLFKIHDPLYKHLENKESFKAKEVSSDTIDFDIRDFSALLQTYTLFKKSCCLCRQVSKRKASIIGGIATF